jgi:hypothetical protein
VYSFKTNLIVFDGLPGSGKSTNAHWLTHHLQKQGVNAVFVPESEIPHPLWWYEVWDGREFRTPDFDHVPIETFIQNSIKKWKDFATGIVHTNQLYIVESFFFQNTVGMFLMGGAKPARVKEYAHEIQKITSRLNPHLIYFRQDDLAAALDRICAIRGKEFEDELTHNMEGFPYLRERHLKGLDGIATLWQAIQSITDALYEEYPVQKVVIETSQRDWQMYRQKILSLVRLD